MSRVELAVYDLSRGMATIMSQQILGQRIDGIWHTGVVVFGIEYFFGGGIQKLPYGVFSGQNQINVVELKLIGTTAKSRSELDSFLNSIGHQYSVSTYDLINNNCNNFSDTVCRFLTGQGIPSHIIDLPRIVFSTPGGQMLRPMIENMNRQMHTQNDGNTNIQPAQFEAQVEQNVMSIIDTALTQQQLQRPGNASASVTAPVEVAVLTDSEKANVDRLMGLVFTSGESNTAKTITEKLINFKSGSLLTEDEKSVIKSLCTSLNTTDSSNTAITLPNESCAIVARVLASESSLQLSCLFLLRLIALYPSNDPTASSTLSNEISSLVKRLQSREGFASAAPKSMALATLVNYSSHSAGRAHLLVDTAAVAEVVDIAVSGLTHAEVSIRLMCAALACNVTLVCTHPAGLCANARANARTAGMWTADTGSGEEVHSHAVQVLCCSLEGLDSESNAVCRFRRLLMAARVLKRCGKAAVSLASDLGLIDTLHELSAKATPPLSSDEQVLLKHLRNLLA